MSDDNAMVTGILRLKLGASCAGPTKAMFQQLNELALYTNRARNAMLRAWERWCEETDYMPAQIVSKKTGEPLFWIKKGRKIPRLKNEPLPKIMTAADDGRKIVNTTWLYHSPVWFGGATGKELKKLYSQLRSSAAKDIWAHLITQLPRDHEGDALYRWQAIRLFETDRGTFRSFNIPVPQSAFCLTLFPADTSAILVGGKQKPTIRDPGRRMLVFEFAAWSRESGRGRVKCRIEDRNLSPGNWRVVQRILSGEWQLSDSELVRRKDVWYLHLCYAQPANSHGLDHDRTAVMMLRAPTDKRPFSVTSPEGKVWFLGDTHLHEQELKRLAARRLALNSRKVVLAGSGRRGHGLQRQYRDVRVLSRRIASITKRLQQSIADDLFKFCVRTNCGSVVIPDPSQPVRGASWFAKRELNFDWTMFHSIVHHKLTKEGLKFTDVFLKMEEWKKQNGGA